ncbi:26448_t:CDS:2, partial [Racocetra persica]
STNRCLDNNDNTILSEIVESPIESENDNNEKKNNQNDQNTNCEVESKNLDNSKDVISDSIQKLFAYIFVNDS